MKLIKYITFYLLLLTFSCSKDTPLCRNLMHSPCESKTENLSSLKGKLDGEEICILGGVGKYSTNVDFRSISNSNGIKYHFVSLDFIPSSVFNEVPSFIITTPRKITDTITSLAYTINLSSIFN